MIKNFEAGEIYEVTYSTWAKYGEHAGTVEILKVEMDKTVEDWKETGIRKCFRRKVGKITFKMDTKANNTKPKTADLWAYKNSEEFAKKYTDGNTEYYGFFTSKNYRPIDTLEKIINK